MENKQVANGFLLKLPSYFGVRHVWALKIGMIIENPRGHELHFEDQRYAPIQVDGSWVEMNLARAGGYFVVHDDGRQSFLPDGAFEAEFMSGGLLHPGIERVGGDGSVILVTYPEGTPQDLMQRHSLMMRGSAEKIGMRVMMVVSVEGAEIDLTDLPEDVMNEHGWYRLEQEGV